MPLVWRHPDEEFNDAMRVGARYLQCRNREGSSDVARNTACLTHVQPFRHVTNSVLPNVVGLVYVTSPTEPGSQLYRRFG